MALPANVGHGFVKGSFIDSDGTPLAGKITLKPQFTVARNVTAATPVTIMPRSRVVELPDNPVTGVMPTTELVATDDTSLGLEPGWTWRVTIEFSGNNAPRHDPFDILIPEGVTVDLTVDGPVGSVDGVQITRGVGVPDTATADDGHMVTYDATSDTTQWVDPWRSGPGITMARLTPSLPTDPIDVAPILQPIIDDAEVGAVIQLPVPPAGQYYHASQITLSGGRTLVGGGFMRVSAGNPAAVLAGTAIRGIPGAFAPGEAVVKCIGARAQLRDINIQATDDVLNSDPSFEAGQGGFGSAAASSISTSTEQARTGVQSLKLERVASGFAPGILSFDAVLGQTITAKGWSYEPAGTSTPGAKIRIGGAAFANTDSTVLAVGDWRYHEVTATATSTDTGSIQLHLGDTVGDIAYWDDVTYGIGTAPAEVTADYAVLDESEDSTHSRVFIEGGNLCAYDASNGKRCNLEHCQVRGGRGAAIYLGLDCQMQGGRKQSGTIILGAASQVNGAHLTGTGLEHGTAGPNVRIVEFGVVIGVCIIDTLGTAGVEIVAPAGVNVSGTDFLQTGSGPALRVDSAGGSGYANLTGCNLTTAPTAGTTPVAFEFGSQVVADGYSLSNVRIPSDYTAAWDFEPYHNLVRHGGVMQPARLS